MKRLRQFFKVSLAKLFFVSNFVICAFVFDWDKFFRYLNTPVRENCHLVPPKTGGGAIDFSIHGMSSYSGGEDLIVSIFMIFLFLFIAIFFIFTLPSIGITSITLEVIKNSFPIWCLETHDIIYLPVFAVINSFYWISLAYIIELGYSKYRQLHPPKNKYTGIFNDF